MNDKDWMKVMIIVSLASSVYWTHKNRSRIDDLERQVKYVQAENSIIIDTMHKYHK